MRTCTTCGETKAVEEFWRHYKQCNGCRKSTYLKRTYGITLDTYNRMFAEQEGACKICGTHQCQTKKAFSVDHCHKTGKVRGLLCANCNTALGKFNDNIELLEGAISYLRSQD